MCVFLFNVTNNTVIVLLVSSLLILLSILLHLLRFRRPVRLNVRLTRLFTVEFRVSIDNFLECRAKPVVLVVVVQDDVVAEDLRAEVPRFMLIRPAPLNTVSTLALDTLAHPTPCKPLEIRAPRRTRLPAPCTSRGVQWE